LSRDFLRLRGHLEGGPTRADALAGVAVGVIALPLAMALAIRWASLLSTACIRPRSAALIALPLAAWRVSCCPS
jgi:MFS superfamily sulfate permease-like transporter